MQKAEAFVDVVNSFAVEDGWDEKTGKDNKTVALALKFNNPHVLFKHLNNFGPLSKKSVSDLLGLNPGSHTSFYPLKEVAEIDGVQVQEVGGQIF